MFEISFVFRLKILDLVCIFVIVCPLGDFLDPHVLVKVVDFRRNIKSWQRSLTTGFQIILIALIQPLHFVRLVIDVSEMSLARL